MTQNKEALDIIGKIRYEVAFRCNRDDSRLIIYLVNKLEASLQQPRVSVSREGNIKRKTSVDEVFSSRVDVEALKQERVNLARRIVSEGDGTPQQYLSGVKRGWEECIDRLASQGYLRSKQEPVDDEKLLQNIMDLIEKYTHVPNAHAVVVSRLIATHYAELTGEK